MGNVVIAGSIIVKRIKTDGRIIITRGIGKERPSSDSGILGAGCGGVKGLIAKGNVVIRGEIADISCALIFYTDDEGLGIGCSEEVGGGVGAGVS